MADVAAQRRALAARAKATIKGVRWYERGQDLTHAPAGVVERVEGPERLGFGSVYRTLYHVVLLPGTGQALVQNGQKLDTYLATSGAASFEAAIDADRTLGGTVDAALVGTPFGDQPYEANGVEYVSTRIPVEVISS